MNMTVKQFVEAIHKTWENDPFLSAATITGVHCRMRYGRMMFFVRLEDHSTVSVYLTEEGKIVFF